jgi:putative glutamine amidotransferase
VATGMDTLRTNSFHHQAVKRVADGFRVAATATDGVVEAIEDPDRGFFGTQFHPEDHTVAGDTVMVKFFEFLVREAGKKAR